MTVLWVALGAAVGAPLRYLTDRAVQRMHRAVFPWGTFTVNVVTVDEAPAPVSAPRTNEPTTFTVNVPQGKTARCIRCTARSVR